MFKLKLKSLKFVSAVDYPAQSEVAHARLLKSDGAIDATFTVAKVSEDPALGLVFGWAMASTLDGGKTAYHDLQGDAIEEADMIKVCAEFMEGGALSDVQHDDNADGKIVFAMPLVKEVNDALGIQSDIRGLAIAMKPSPETFKRFQSGELRGFSIAGMGERTAKSAPAPVDPAKLAADLLAKKAQTKKRAVLTAITAGHTHLVPNSDELQNGVTSSTDGAAGDGPSAYGYHSHPWVKDEKGTITIGAAAGHTHAMDDAPAEMQLLDSEVEASAKAVNASIREQIAAMPVARGGADLPVEKGATDEEICKSVYEVKKKAEDAYREYVAKYARANYMTDGKAGVELRKKADPTFLELSAAVANAAAAVTSTPTQTAMLKAAPLVARGAAIRAEMLAMIEKWALAWNMTMRDAENRLRVVSPTFREIEDQWRLAERERLHVFQSTAARIEHQMMFVAANSADATGMAASLDAAARRLSTESTTQKAFRERCEGLAEKYSLKYPDAVRKAMQEDPVAQQLYGAIQLETVGVN